MRVVITVPDGFYDHETADYMRYAADQMEEGYVSGHVNPDQHWVIES